MFTLAPSQTVTSRDSKGLKFMSIIEAAYNKAGLSGREAQRVNDTPGLAKLIDAFIAEHRFIDPFDYAEIASSYVYPAGYAIALIGEQINALAGIFELSLGSTMEFMEKVFPTLTLPDWAEGWFAIPSVDALATRFFPNVEDPAARYCEAVKVVVAKIAASRRFYHHHDDIRRGSYRMNAETATAMALVTAQQKGDVLVIPAQFGIRHRGRSVRQACEAMPNPEFGLGMVAVGSMLLTHPKRLVSLDDLWIDVPGDEYDRCGFRTFESVPFVCFSIGIDGVAVESHDVSDDDPRFGSPSACVPQ